VRKLAAVLTEGGGVVVEERGDLLVALFGDCVSTRTLRSRT
jgi:hypothetical protein